MLRALSQGDVGVTLLSAEVLLKEEQPCGSTERDDGPAVSSWDVPVPCFVRPGKPSI